MVNSYEPALLIVIVNVSVEFTFPVGVEMRPTSTTSIPPEQAAHPFLRATPVNILAGDSASYVVGVEEVDTGTGVVVDTGVVIGDELATGLGEAAATVVGVTTGSAVFSA